MMKGLLYLRQQLLKIEMCEDYRLKMDIIVFVRRKNVVVCKLDLAVKVLTTAFGVELDDIVRQHRLRILVIVMMPKTMYALSGSIAKTTRDMMVFGAIMELHVPAN